MHFKEGLHGAVATLFSHERVNLFRFLHCSHFLCSVLYLIFLKDLAFLSTFCRTIFLVKFTKLDLNLFV